MVSTKVWIALCLVATVVSIFLYKAIDSTWARESNVTILITIAFFISAAAAVLCAFNAATMNKHTTGTE